MSSVGFLAGQRISLLCVPKFGSSTIRKFYTKDTEHAESTHVDYNWEEIANYKGDFGRNMKFIMFTKDFSEVFHSSIQTDLISSALQMTEDVANAPLIFPKFSKWLYKIPFDKKKQYISDVVNCTYSQAISKYHNPTAFIRYGKEVISKSFNLLNDCSWMFKGHFSNSQHSVPKLYNLPNVYMTKIENLSNPKFIEWLKNNDSSWNYLNSEISKIKDSFSTENSKDKGQFNSKPIGFTNNVTSWIHKIEKDNPKIQLYNMDIGKFTRAIEKYHGRLGSYRANQIILEQVHYNILTLNELFEKSIQTGRYIDFTEGETPIQIFGQ